MIPAVYFLIFLQRGHNWYRFTLATLSTDSCSLQWCRCPYIWYSCITGSEAFCDRAQNIRIGKMVGRLRGEKSRRNYLAYRVLSLKKKNANNLDLIFFFFLSEIKRDPNLFSNLLVIWKLVVKSCRSDVVYN